MIHKNLSLITTKKEEIRGIFSLEIKKFLCLSFLVTVR